MHTLSLKEVAEILRRPILAVRVQTFATATYVYFEGIQIPS